MKNKEHIIINLEHKLIQICVFQNQWDHKHRPFFMKNYHVKHQRKQADFKAKVDQVLEQISKRFALDIEQIYFIYYDNQVISKQVSVKVLTHHDLKLDWHYFERVKSNLLANTIIKKKYESCGFWINSIVKIPANSKHSSTQLTSEAVVECNFLLKSELQQIQQLVQSVKYKKRLIHLIPVSKAIQAYLLNSQNIKIQHVCQGDAPLFIIDILDNRIVIYRYIEGAVGFYRSFSFGIMSIIGLVMKQLQIDIKICTELFFSVSYVFYNFGKHRIGTSTVGKSIQIITVYEEFMRVLVRKFLPIFTGEMNKVLILGRTTESYIFHEFINTELRQIETVITDSTKYLRARHWVLFKLIGANYLLTNQEKYFQ